MMAFFSDDTSLLVLAAQVKELKAQGKEFDEEVNKLVQNCDKLTKLVQDCDNLLVAVFVPLVVIPAVTAYFLWRLGKTTDQTTKSTGKTKRTIKKLGEDINNSSVKEAGEELEEDINNSCAPPPPPPPSKLGWMMCFFQS